MGLVSETNWSRVAMCGIAALLVECGGISNDDAAPRGSGDGASVVSGYRLEVLTWRYGDLALPALPTTIFDTGLGVGCDFEIGSDGVERCLPFNHLGIAVEFLEPTCESPVASMGERCENNGYVVAAGERSLCGGRVEFSVYEVGREIETPSVLYERADGACRASSRGPDSYPYYSLELAPPSRFVGAERVVVPKTPTLGVEVLVGSDGTRLPLSVYDLQRDRACSFYRVDEDNPSEFHCLGPTASTGVYRDTRCSEDAAVFETYLGCEPPELVVQHGPFFCSTDTLFERGDEVSFGWRREGDDGCSEEDQEGSRFFALGEATRGDAYARVEETVIGSGRLASHGYVQDGVPVLPLRFWDSLAGDACAPKRARDGRTYCVPMNQLELFYRFEHYADAACSDGLQTETLWECGGPPSSFVGRSTGVLAECEERELESLYRALPYEGETVYTLSSSGECVPEPSDPALRYYRVGAPLEPADVYVELTKE